MAGIGFELQKVLQKGGLGSFFKVALSGVIIVAGPWLLSIVGIFLIGRLAGFALAENRDLFIGVIVYSYAFSLFIFGGSHYIFTRYVADLIYLDKKRASATALIISSLFVFVLSCLIAWLALSGVSAGVISHGRLFKLSAMFFFAFINVMWLLMIFISLLKQYMSIFVVFLIGMTCSLVGVILLGSYMALGGAMLGFASGQGLTVIMLLILSLKDFRPGKLSVKEFLSYFLKYKYLFLTGLFYYWGIWIDKMIFWVGVGSSIPGSFIRLFDLYDIPVYFANLTMIPGLIYFVVVSETGFYVHLKGFLLSLGNGIYRVIQEKKYVLARKMKEGIREQNLFQGVITAVFMLLAPVLSDSLFGGSVNPLILRLTLLAVFFQLLFLTLVTFLFYFQMYLQSFIASLVFFVVNSAGSLLILKSGRVDLYGASYLLAGIAASVVTAVFLFTATRTLERRVYAQYSS